MTARQGDVAARKAEHLALALGADADVAAVGLTTGLELERLRARALPERALDDVDLAVDVLGRRLAAPLLVSCMTGGATEAGGVNRALASAAQAHGVAMGLGSGRALLEGGDPSSFLVRDVAPDVLLLANVGAAQLREVGVEGCARLVERCGADGLVVHLNAVQEAVQPGGDTDFGGVLEALEDLCAALPVPVVVKEVGFGIGPDDVAVLVDAGVAGVDVAGAGGTNWARIEGRRGGDEAAAVAAAFADWGWPTADAIRAARVLLDAHESPALLVGSGGIRDGVEAAKALCLGADVAGVARGLLAAAAEGPDAATRAVGVLVRQLRIATWAVGAASIADLDATRLV